MRYVGSILTAALLMASASARAEQWEHNYAVSGNPRVLVETNGGDVEVSGGQSGQVRARIITHGWKIGQDLKIEEKQSGNQVELRVHRSRKTCFGLCLASTRIEIRVPRDSDLDVDTGDGGVRIDEVRGDLRVATNDGDISMRDIEGRLHATTNDGSVHVNGRLDLMNLRTGDGDIDADITPSLSPQPGWSLHTGDGNLRLRLPSQFGAELDARTGDGEVRVDFPLASLGSNQQSRVRGNINGGGIPIELRTGDGNIHVEKQ